MAVLDNWDSKVNFWKANSQLSAAGVFKEIYKEDKTEGRAHSSSLMWSIAFAFDPRSKYINMIEDDRIDLIFNDVFKDKTWPVRNKELFNQLRDFYRLLNETPAQRALRGIEDKLMERDRFIRDTPYTLGEKGDKAYIFGTADDLDKMMSNTVKVWDLYDRARKTVSDEQQQGTAIGGAIQSLSDTGEI